MEADQCQSNPSTWCCLATLASSGQFSPQTSNHLISTLTTPSRQTTSFPISQIKQKQLGENYLQLPATKVKFSELMFTFSFFLSTMMEATSLLPWKTDPPLGLWVWVLSAFLSTVLNNKPLILGVPFCKSHPPLSAAQLLELSRLIPLPHSHSFLNSLKSSFCSHQSAGIYLATDKTW